jgi:flagella basal body P-ring formation protein FlgA
MMTRTRTILTRLAAATFLVAAVPAAGAVSLATIPAADAAGQDLPLILRDRVTVDQSDLMLSDLFSNLAVDADRRIGDAPKPGEQMVLGSRQIWDYAKAYGLNWQPIRSKVAVVITRSSAEVPNEVIADAIAARLAEEHIADDFDIDLFTRRSNLHVATDAPLAVEIHALSYEPRTKRFHATVGVEDGRLSQLTGKIVPMVAVPTLRRHAMPGQVITDDMIAWQRVPTRQAGVTTVTRHDDILGQTARRPLTAGVPIRLTDLKPNLMVTKGDVVTLMVRTGAMTLTARGQALESGTKGAVIRIRNTQSDRVIEARVIAPDVAAVESNALTNLAALSN